MNKLHQELMKKSKIIAITKKKLRQEQLRISNMSKNMKLLDFKPIQVDIDYLRQIKNQNESQVALSALVTKLQRYIFDVEQTGLKEQYKHHDTNENFETYDIDNDENLNLGNSQELEASLKNLQHLQSSIEQYEQSQDHNIEISIDEEGEESENEQESDYQQPIESYAQQYQKKKSR